MTATTPKTIQSDVLVIGAGGAGMTAAISAADSGANVVLVDRNMIGRGGATIMAQMTVAAALAEQEPDTWEDHLVDTIQAGRGLCDETLAEVVCREAPARMRTMDEWGVGWARQGGDISQVMAPGHRVARCCYVDFLNTGPAVAQTLRRKLGRLSNVRRLSDVLVTELLKAPSGEVCGAHAVEVSSGAGFTLQAGAVIIATGGLTRLYARTSASGNMAGEGYALALQAGARLIDMEFVQFFPIGHLAPRLIGMDPIMWDPFRYKLGGRLLNSHGEEFMDQYGSREDGKYTATRDLATFAIHKEVQAGRGSPHGGAFLSFQHIGADALRDAFGPIVDRLAKNGIDLAKQSIEVSPIAHYHMGGIQVDKNMFTGVPGLFAAGEAVGGASGANRLSGNAISEALVFGDVAGRAAASHVKQMGSPPQSSGYTPVAPHFGAPTDQRSANQIMHQLQQLMWRSVGPFRDETGLTEALATIGLLRDELEQQVLPDDQVYAMQLFDWYETRAALLVAQCVATAALDRRESRGAHQREDFEATHKEYERSATISMSGEEVKLNG